jgi:hypothetical protein
MAATYLRAKLPNDRRIYIEVTPTAPSVSNADEAPSDVRIFPRSRDVVPTDVSIVDDLRLDDIAEAIQAVSTMMIGAVRKAKPSKASVEFGVEIGVTAGQLTALLVKGSGKATLSVKVEWDGASAAPDAASTADSEK